jgi:hypothetical protein
MSDFRHESFGSLHTFVDLISNTVVLEEIDFAKHYAKIFSQSLLQHALGPALHELTHHWCFDSPVGSTLALLKLESNHAIFTGRSQRDVFDPFARLRIATQILRPIAEGLALFAELDMLPGPGDVRAPIVGRLLSMFSQELMFDKEIPWDNLFSYLVTEARTSERGLRNKENLVSQPLHIKAGGPLWVSKAVSGSRSLGDVGLWVRLLDRGYGARDRRSY